MMRILGWVSCKSGAHKWTRTPGNCGRYCVRCYKYQPDDLVDHKSAGIVDKPVPPPTILLREDQSFEDLDRLIPIVQDRSM